MTQEGNGTFVLIEQTGAGNTSTSDQPGNSVNANTPSRRAGGQIPGGPFVNFDHDRAGGETAVQPRHAHRRQAGC